PPEVARNSATYKALAQVGAEGAQLFGEIAARHKALEDEKFASESALQDTVDYHRNFTELQKQSNGGIMPDGRTLSEHAREWAQERQKERLGAAPSSAARDGYSGKIASFFAKEQLRAEQVEL